MSILTQTVKALLKLQPLVRNISSHMYTYICTYTIITVNIIIFILHPHLQPRPQAFEIRQRRRPKKSLARTCPVAHTHTENGVLGNNRIHPLTYVYHCTSLYTHHHGRC